MWRYVEHICSRPFRLAVPHWFSHGSVSTSRSSNRTGGFAASGSRTRRHAFTHDATKLGQAYEPEVLVKVREWISSALASPDFVLEPQPPAQPHSRVVVEHPIRFAGGANAEVIGPSAKRLVQLIHQPCGLLPSSRSDGQRVDSFDHALEALL